MDRRFLAIVVVLIGGSIAYITFKNSGPKEAILGVQHPIQVSNHIAANEEHEPYNSNPASSGPHYANQFAPAEWGVYTDEVPDEVFLHNQEHGGIIVTYKPDLAPDQLKKLQELFAPPYSNKAFTPIKAIVTPRSKNTKPIQLASWGYTLDLDQYDEATITKFYLQRIGKSPEPSAGPSNKPINQAAR